MNNQIQNEYTLAEKVISVLPDIIAIFTSCRTSKCFLKNVQFCGISFYMHLEGTTDPLIWIRY